MKAARIHSFGPPDVVVVEDVPMPSPGPNEVLVQVMAAGVAPWDAIIREGKSKVSPQPPLTLGSDFSGVVGKVGPGVTGFASADEVYGVTNPQFCGAQAEFAVARSRMIARKPQSLNHIEAASAPVIAVTAWQMLFQYAEAIRGQTVMVVGAAGNVGAYTVQMAEDAGIHVVAIARLDDEDLLRSFLVKLGVESIIDSSKPGFEQNLPHVDAILDTVGGSTLQRCIAALKPGGKLVTSVSTQPLPAEAIFFYAEVTTARLQTLTTLFDAGRITVRVGSILPLSQARQAQCMLAGAPHKSGKIVLQVGSKYRYHRPIVRSLPFCFHNVTRPVQSESAFFGSDREGYQMDSTNEPKKIAPVASNTPESSKLSVNVFTAPGKTMVGERPKPFGEPFGFDPITSTLIFGEYDAVLVDAMCTVAEAEALAGWVALHNRNLETIYITHAHFDHFYGLGILLDRFPGARAIATPKTLNAIQMYLSPPVQRLARRMFPGQVPTKLVAPEPYERDTFSLEGHELRIIEQGRTDSPDSTSLYVPSIGLIVAGDVVYNQCRMYVGDTTPESRKNWIADLDRLAALNPTMVVAGHKKPGATDSPSTIQNTKRYLEDFDRLQKTAKSDQELFDQMTELYPHWVANQSWLMFGFPGA